MTFTWLIMHDFISKPYDGGPSSAAQGERFKFPTKDSQAHKIHVWVNQETVTVWIFFKHTKKPTIVMLLLGSPAVHPEGHPIYIYIYTQLYTDECILLGGSGGVVNSLDFCLASLKSLGCFYFRCVLSSQWKAVTVNLQILHCQL